MLLLSGRTEAWQGVDEVGHEECGQWDEWRCIVVMLGIELRQAICSLETKG
jgi:hypothetical protein